MDIVKLNKILKLHALPQMEIPEQYKIKKLVIDYLKSVPDEVPDLGISSRILAPGSERLKAMTLTLSRLISRN